MQYKFDSDRIQANAEIKWWAVSMVTRNDFVQMLLRTTMDLNDDYWGFGTAAEEGFYYQDKPGRQLPYKNDF